MKTMYFFLICLLLISCSGTKSSYNSQQELDAYLGNSSRQELTPITSAEQKNNVVVFDYLIKITGSKIAGIKMLDFFNSGQINYWIHFRTTTNSNLASFVLPGPIPSVKSKVELFVKVTNSSGVTYFEKKNLTQFLTLYQGEIVSDLSGKSRIELKSIPPDCEIEYTLKQELSSIPYSLSFQFVDNVVYRKVNFRVDTGNDLNPAYLTTPDSFFFLNENKTETLVEKFVKANEAISDGTLQLTGNFSIQNKNETLSSTEPVVFYFPLDGERINKTDKIYSAKLNLNRNTFHVIGKLAEYQRTGYISSIKTQLNLGTDTDKRLKTQPIDQQKKTILKYISSVSNWNEIANEHFDFFFITYDLSFMENISSLIWFSNIEIPNSGFCLENDSDRIIIKETSTLKQCNSVNFIELKF